ncbi:unnamed protein product [Symbiodinium sp. CCMP2592]|nr:unnamed protein product [Symbiodinium sp. CCMP2592]
MAWFLSRLERQALAGFAVCVVVTAVLHEVMQLRDLATSIQTQLLEDHYSTLGVAVDASQAEITTAYRRATNKISSKQQDKQSRAKLSAAYDTLSGASRPAYDKRRQFVMLASFILLAALVSVPAVFLAYFCARVLVRVRGRDLDPQSFTGRVNQSLQNMELSLEVKIAKDQDGPLGAQLMQVDNGKRLQICKIAGEGLIHQHNAKVFEEREGRDAVGISPAGMVWWHLPLLRESDIIESVNEKRGATDMMNELQSGEEWLSLRIRRRLVGGASVLPFLFEQKLTRRENERWGCELVAPPDESDSLQVAGDVLETSSHEASAGTTLRPGDRIVSVGSVVGSKMLDTLRDSSLLSLSLLVVRGVLMPPGLIQASPKEVSCGPLQKREGQKLGIRIGHCFESPPAHGILLGPGCASSMVVKEVVPGHLVDQWNVQQASSDVLLPSCVIVAVNGRRQSQEFATELAKPVVTIVFRPLPAELVQRPEVQVKEPSCESADSGQRRHVRPLHLDIDEEALRPWPSRVLHGWAPRWLLPRPFEERLRNHLRLLHCEFTVRIERPDETRRLGLHLQSDRGGLQVLEVADGGLVAQHNHNIRLASRSATEIDVRRGDRLVAVGSTTSPGAMMDQLAKQGQDDLELRFTRPAAKSAPGVWEIDIRRSENQGWGLELSEVMMTTPAGPRSAGVLKVQRVAEEAALGQWNSSQDAQWCVEPGDLLVACEPEVEPKQILQRLRGAQEVRLTFLRWHKGAAPEPEALPSEPGRTSFEVVISRTGEDRLGLRLRPCSRDPTRTVVSEVVPDSLVDRHNKAMPDNQIVQGDEVDSVNGEGDPARFPDCCSQSRIVFRLTRRSKRQASTGEEEAEQAQAEPPSEPPVEPPTEPAAGVLEQTGQSLSESRQPPHSEHSEHLEASEGRQGQEGQDEGDGEGQGGSQPSTEGVEAGKMPLDKPEEFVEVSQPTDSAPQQCADVPGSVGSIQGHLPEADGRQQTCADLTREQPPLPREATHRPGREVATKELSSLLLMPAKAALLASLAAGLDTASRRHLEASLDRLQELSISMGGLGDGESAKSSQLASLGPRSQCRQRRRVVSSVLLQLWLKEALGLVDMYYDFDWKDAPLSSHSTPVIAGCLYLLMVLLLPRCVPEGGFKLDKTLVVHNFILSFMSLVLCLGCAFEMVQRVRSESSVEWMFCENRSMSARGPLYFWSWAFYASKYYELVDTLLALLRASRPPHFGLHVYHHALVPVMVWHWLEYCTTLQHIGLLWNTFVHVVMYAYYALKVLKVPTPWKSWVTRLQIIQFVSSMAAFMPAMYYMWESPLGDACAGQRSFLVNLAFNLTLLWQFVGVLYTPAAGAKKGGHKKE